jgi:hypothetical protein
LVWANAVTAHMQSMQAMRRMEFMNFAVWCVLCDFEEIRGNRPQISDLFVCVYDITNYAKCQ